VHAQQDQRSPGAPWRHPPGGFPHFTHLETRMKSPRLHTSVALLVLTFSFLVCTSHAQMFGNLLQMMGGMDVVQKLAGSFLKSSMSDPRLSGLLGKADAGALTPKLTDQMCSMLSGPCKAPLTNEQITAGASKVDSTQTKALGENFSSSLDSVTSNPLIKEGVSKAIAPKLGGIVGALL